MQDRISTQVLENGAIRYAIYDEQGNFLRYEYILAADDPVQEGTPLNKKTFLQDVTASLIGLEEADPTVDDALLALAERGIGILTTSFVGDGNASASRTFTTTGKPVAIFISGDGINNARRSYLGQTAMLFITSTEGLVTWGSKTVNVKNIAFENGKNYNVTVLYNSQASMVDLTVTVVDDNGASIPNCTVQGLFLEDGSNAVTGSDGKATGIALLGSTLRVVSDYWDLSPTEYPTVAEELAPTITLPRVTSGTFQFNSSTSIKLRFSHSMTIEVVSGGDGGGGGENGGDYNESPGEYGTGGPGGKYLSTSKMVAAGTYSLVVGTGGEGGANSIYGDGRTFGSDGGNSSFAGVSSIAGSALNNPKTIHGVQIGGWGGEGGSGSTTSLNSGSSGQGNGGAGGRGGNYLNAGGGGANGKAIGGGGGGGGGGGQRWNSQGPTSGGKGGKGGKGAVFLTLQS